MARFAEQIVKEEKRNPAVVLCAAYLHDIGIHVAERKYNSTAARFHQKEGPPIAREILVKLGARQEIIDVVCDIIGQTYHPPANPSLTSTPLLQFGQGPLFKKIRVSAIKTLS